MEINIYLLSQSHQTNVLEKTKTRVLCSVNFFENLAVRDRMWKNMAQPERPPIKIQHGACALHAG